MKILKSLVLVALVAVAFTSCKKDETTLPAPVITFTNNLNETTVAVGSNWTITGTISSEEGLTEVKYFEVTNLGETQIGQAVTSFTNANSYAFQLTIPDIDAQTVIKVMATDAKNQTTSKNYTIKVNTTGTPLSYENTSGVIWNIIGANPGAWDLVNNVAVIATGAESSKDMKNTTTVTTGWSNEWISGTNNNTLFVKANTFVYATGTSEDAASAYALGTPNTKVTNPAVNDIYIAKLRGSTNYAVIKIISVVVTPSDNLDKITFSYKKVTQTSGK